MRTSHASVTAQAVAVMRVLASTTDTTVIAVDDAVSEQVLSAGARLIVRSWRALGRFSRPMARATYAIAGHLFDHVALRTATIDATIEAAVADGATQLVLLGAGMDMRPFRLPCLANVTVFEVDHPASQRTKRRRTAHLTSLAGALHHVAVDFNRDDLVAELRSAGLDEAQTTYFLCEGVFPYLGKESIAATLRAVSLLAAPGSSTLVASYMPKGASLAPQVQALSALALSVIGEPLGRRFDTGEFAALADAEGLACLWDKEPTEWLRDLGLTSRSPIYRYERLIALQRKA